MKLAYILFILAGLILLHHWWTSGKWFDLEDFLHHEVIAVELVFLGIVMLL